MSDKLRIEDIANQIQQSLRKSMRTINANDNKDAVAFQIVDFKISLPLYLDSLNEKELLFKNLNIHDLLVNGKTIEAEKIQLTRLEFNFKPTINEVIESKK